ncbi:MAG: DUF4180 domain-containing protein [Archangium gephyra]|uniref:DUF4180 domain-containing protein n=1 Tax=Archangium gephyra TaxID=48 RepID=A0A2W5V5W1_9BACT|nr:MAG: DUF4180 domain-containing protein [Archangium gephyra]
MKTFTLEAQGPVIASSADVSNLIGQTWGQAVDSIVVPVSRLHADFFDLKTGFAGELLQKLVNHQLKLVVVGDVSAHVARSDAFRDFVREAQRGTQVRFVDAVRE